MCFSFVYCGRECLSNLPIICVKYAKHSATSRLAEDVDLEWLGKFIYQPLFDLFESFNSSFSLFNLFHPISSFCKGQLNPNTDSVKTCFIYFFVGGGMLGYHYLIFLNVGSKTRRIRVQFDQVFKHTNTYKMNMLQKHASSQKVPFFLFFFFC